MNPDLSSLVSDPPAKPRRIVTIRTAMHRLEVSRTKAFSLIKEKKLERAVIPGRRTHVTEESVERLIDAAIEAGRNVAP